MTIWSEKAVLYAYHHKDTPESLATQIYQGQAQATSELYDRLEGRTALPRPEWPKDSTWKQREAILKDHRKKVRAAAKELAKDYVLVTFKLVRNGGFE